MVDSSDTTELKESVDDKSEIKVPDSSLIQESISSDDTCTTAVKVESCESQPSEDNVDQPSQVSEHSEAAKTNETNTHPASNESTEQPAKSERADDCDDKTEATAKIEGSCNVSTDEAAPMVNNVKKEEDSGNIHSEEGKTNESKPRERKRKSGWDTSSEGALIHECSFK